MFFDRLMLNEDGDTFLPSNVEGDKGVSTSKFFSDNKKMGLGIGLLVNVIIVMQIVKYSLPIIIIAIILLIALNLFLIDRFIIESPFYKKAFDRLERNYKTTAGIDYGILFFNEVEDGTTVGFVDGAIGVFVSLTRESIVGRSPDWVDRQKDSFSDFLKSLHAANYNIIKCNITTQASDDSRFTKFEEETKEIDNKFVRNILQLNLREMKSTASYTYYDQDIYLIYTTNYLKLNEIVRDVKKLTSPLLQVGFLNRKIMNEPEILRLHTLENGTGAFNSMLAKSLIFEDRKATRHFDLYSIKFKNGNELVLTDRQRKKLTEIYSQYIYNKSMKIDLLNVLIEEDDKFVAVKGANDKKTKATSIDSSATGEEEEFVALDIDSLTGGAVKKDEEITEIRTEADLIENEDMGV